ncbi:MAG: aldo/keto reductase [Christensenellales bacterium]
MRNLKDTYVLNNGVQIPCVGFGTWQVPDGNIAVESVAIALENGYVHIDTAAAYDNESSVGRAVIESGIDRKSLFITTKIPNYVRGYEQAISQIDKSIMLLGTDYIDLMLIHWPAPKLFRDTWEQSNAETWRAMEDAVRDGKLRAIGVSNFLPHHMEALKKTERMAPAVNQIRLCPGDAHQPTIDYCEKRGILLQAYSPLGTGALLGLPELVKLAEIKGRTPAQLLLRWSLQNGFLPLPKSVTKERIISNAQIFDFDLTKDEMELISRLSAEEISFRDPDTRPF